jgi:hypothetical protein
MQRTISSILHSIRRNHALEHATIQILSSRKRYTFLAGYSDWRGFWVLGEVDIQDLQNAAMEALARLKGGEAGLAIHPHCGTNFAVSGLLAGSAAMLALAGAGTARKRLERFPMLISLVTLALIAAQPLGPKAQQHLTTCPQPGSLAIVSVQVVPLQSVKAHRVLTSGAQD